MHGVMHDFIASCMTVRAVDCMRTTCTAPPSMATIATVTMATLSLAKVLIRVGGGMVARKWSSLYIVRAFRTVGLAILRECLAHLV